MQLSLIRRYLNPNQIPQIPLVSPRTSWMACKSISRPLPVRSHTVQEGPGVHDTRYCDAHTWQLWSDSR